MINELNQSEVVRSQPRLRLERGQRFHVQPRPVTQRSLVSRRLLLRGLFLLVAWLTKVVVAAVIVVIHYRQVARGAAVARPATIEAGVNIGPTKVSTQRAPYRRLFVLAFT